MATFRENPRISVNKLSEYIAILIELRMLEGLERCPLRGQRSKPI
jgi:hypothetical protein